ncbi:MAG: hypothetical protein SWH68_10575 [Thermodesulfobacteriota bacterium]|nr:hypothetical protein [Thermodesulfobacteriota bacterium]
MALFEKNAAGNGNQCTGKKRDPKGFKMAIGSYWRGHGIGNNIGTGADFLVPFQVDKRSRAPRAGTQNIKPSQS